LGTHPGLDFLKSYGFASGRLALLCLKSGWFWRFLCGQTPQAGLSLQTRYVAFIASSCRFCGLLWRTGLGEHAAGIETHLLFTYGLGDTVCLAEKVEVFADRLLVGRTTAEGIFVESIAALFKLIT